MIGPISQPSDFSPVKTQRVFEIVADQIHAQMQSGALRVGDRLPNERDLAAHFQISRHAVREALRNLESRGVVRLKKGAKGGAFLTDAQHDAVASVMRGMFQVGGISLTQLTEARLWIEAVVVREASLRADAVALAHMEENVARAAALTQAGRMAEKTQVNIEFHILLAEATGNPVLVMMMKALMDVLRTFVIQIGSVMAMDVIQSRQRLLQHMKMRDADAAVKEMEQHLKRLHRHYIESAMTRSLEQNGESVPTKQ